MNVFTYVWFGTAVVQDAPEYRARPLTPRSTKVAIGQYDSGLRLDAMLGEICGNTLDVGSTTTLGLGSLYEVIELVQVILLVLTNLGVPVQQADTLGVHGVTDGLDLSHERGQFELTDRP